VKNISAFPVYAPEAENPGMTLLDYFAGQALAGMTKDIGWLDEDGPKAAAQAAYRTAAAMLEEREKLLRQEAENDGV